jgi:hypothetical protein
MNEALTKYSKPAAIVVLIASLLIAASWAYNYLYYTLPPQLVSITLKYQPEPPCRKDSPLYMQITNDSYRDVLGTSFVLSVKVDDEGDNIAQLLSNKYSTDTLIEARSTHQGCWSYPRLYVNKHDPHELIYEAKDQLINFSD